MTSGQSEFKSKYSLERKKNGGKKDRKIIENHETFYYINDRLTEKVSCIYIRNLHKKSDILNWCPHRHGELKVA